MIEIDRVTGLRQMKDLIITQGWIRGQTWSPEGFCLLGAAERVLDATPRNTPGEVLSGRQLVAALCDAIKRRPALKCGSLQCSSQSLVAHWNDTHCENVADAVALIDEALLLLAGGVPLVAEAPPRKTWWRVKFDSHSKSDAELISV